jgi:hypothetical protein
MVSPRMTLSASKTMKYRYRLPQAFKKSRTFPLFLPSTEMRRR